jgi:Ca2+-binding EF-hand superfamily protein
MMMTRTLMIVSLFTMASTGVALADHHGDGDHRKYGMMKERMMEMDTNKDGVISREEFLTGHKAKFSDADTNGDGQVTKDEFVAHWDRKEAERRQQMQDRKFSKLDANGDGVVTQEEFDAHGAKMFEMMDSNKDGNLTKDDRSKDGWHKKHNKGKGDKGKE